MKRFLKEVTADLVKQMWTFVGLFSAWLVLTGSAKKVVGVAILIGIIIWIATFNLRHHETSALKRRIREENEERRKLLRRKKVMKPSTTEEIVEPSTIEETL